MAGFSAGSLSVLQIGPVNTAANFVAGLGNSALTALPQVPQMFFTTPFANNQTVLYKLEIILSTGNLSSTLNAPQAYIFPLTPSNVTKSTINLTNYYDVQGSAGNYGVQRIIDQYGLTPPIITISGTTGFQFHSLDNYKWSGKSSFALLVQMIQSYAQLVIQAATSSQSIPFPTMTFTDGFTGEMFNVVPISKQAFEMDVSKPIIQMYNLQFLAQSTVTPTAVSLSQLDPINQAFIAARALSTAGVLSWWNNIIGTLSTGAVT